MAMASSESRGFPMISSSTTTTVSHARITSNSLLSAINRFATSNAFPAAVSRTNSAGGNDLGRFSSNPLTTTKGSKPNSFSNASRLGDWLARTILASGTSPSMANIHVDLIFRRSLLLSKLFTKSWGAPKNLETIHHFRENYMGKGLVGELIERKTPTMVITKEWHDKEIQYMEGHFRSPLYEYCPELFPAKVETCHWRGIFPTNEDARRGLVIHLAGTGDHTYFRRQYGFTNDLLKLGYSAILVENPFYGSRKPDGQFSSSLMNVCDLFIMGGSLIAECGFLLKWAKEQGHTTLGLSGVSMGGYMASLAASNVPEAIALVPLLSWSTAAPVYTEGALSEAINWPGLRAELRSKEFIQAIEKIQNCNWLDKLHDKNFLRHTDDAKRFMWILMEEFTNMGKFPVPVAPTLIKAIIAEDDAYVVRKDVPDLRTVWPGSQVEVVQGVGHVAAYLLNHARFRKAIQETMESVRVYQGLDTEMI